MTGAFNLAFPQSAGSGISLASVHTDLHATQEYLHREIPLSRAMGMRVVSYDGDRLVLDAPLEPNSNHLGTAFGGSLMTLATLAGYGWVWLHLGEPKAHVVIRQCTSNFKRPVQKSVIRAVAERPSDDVLETFQLELARNGKARIELAIFISEDDAVAVEFHATFVAVREK